MLPESAPLLSQSPRRTYVLPILGSVCLFVVATVLIAQNDESNVELYGGSFEQPGLTTSFAGFSNPLPLANHNDAYYWKCGTCDMKDIDWPKAADDSLSIKFPQCLKGFEFDDLKMQIASLDNKWLMFMGDSVLEDQFHALVDRFSPQQKCAKPGIFDEPHEFSLICRATGCTLQPLGCMHFTLPGKVLGVDNYPSCSTSEWVDLVKEISATDVSFAITFHWVPSAIGREPPPFVVDPTKIIGDSEFTELKAPMLQSRFSMDSFSQPGAIILGACSTVWAWPTSDPDYVTKERVKLFTEMVKNNLELIERTGFKGLLSVQNCAENSCRFFSSDDSSAAPADGAAPPANADISPERPHPPPPRSFRIGDRVPKRAGDKVPKRVGDRVPKRVGDKVPKRVGDKVPKKVGGSETAYERGYRHGSAVGLKALTAKSEAQIAKRQANAYSSSDEPDFITGFKAGFADTFNGGASTAGDKVPKKSGDRVPKRAGDKVPKKVGDKVPKKVGDKVPKRVGDKVPKKAGDKVPKKAGEAEASDSTATDSASTTDAYSRGYARGAEAANNALPAAPAEPAGYSAQDDQDYADGFLAGYTNALNGDSSVGDKVPKKSGDKVPKRAGDKVPKKVGDRVPKKVGDRVPKKVGDRVPKKAGDKVPKKAGDSSSDAYSRGYAKGAEAAGNTEDDTAESEASSSEQDHQDFADGFLAGFNSAIGDESGVGDKVPKKSGDKVPKKAGDRVPKKVGDKVPKKVGDKVPKKAGDKVPKKAGDSSSDAYSRGYAKGIETAARASPSSADAIPAPADTTPEFSQQDEEDYVAGFVAGFAKAHSDDSSDSQSAGDKVPKKIGDKVPKKIGDKVPKKVGDKVPKRVGDKVPKKAGDRVPKKSGDDATGVAASDNTAEEVETAYEKGMRDGVVAGAKARVSTSVVEPESEIARTDAAAQSASDEADFVRGFEDGYEESFSAKISVDTAGDKVPKKSGDRVPKKVGDKVPKKVGDKVPKRVGDKVPKRAGDKVPKKSGDRVPKKTGESDEDDDNGSAFERGFLLGWKKHEEHPHASSISDDDESDLPSFSDASANYIAANGKKGSNDYKRGLIWGLLRAAKKSQRSKEFAQGVKDGIAAFDPAMAVPPMEDDEESADAVPADASAEDSSDAVGDKVPKKTGDKVPKKTGDKVPKKVGDKVPKKSGARRSLLSHDTDIKAVEEALSEHENENDQVDAQELRQESAIKSKLADAVPADAPADATDAQRAVDTANAVANAVASAAKAVSDAAAAAAGFKSAAPSVAPTTPDASPAASPENLKDEFARCNKVNANLDLVSASLAKMVSHARSAGSIIDINQLSKKRPDLYTSAHHMCSYEVCAVVFDAAEETPYGSALPPTTLCDAALQVTWNSLFRNRHCQTWAPTPKAVNIDHRASQINKAVNW